MLLKNTSSVRVNYKSHGMPRILVEPGATVEIDDAYCVPRKGENPDNELPSIISLLAPQLEPVNPDEPKRVVDENAAKIKAELKSEVPDFQALVAAGMPRAKARAKVERAMALKQAGDSELEEDMTDAASDRSA